MAKVLQDIELINQFLERGVDSIFPSKEALKQKLLSGDRIRVYQGFDPSGPYLHIGHAMGIRALRILQKLGHEVIFLVGDYTARVGDPDKDKTRELLTVEKIEENKKGWKQQAAQIIDFEGENPVLFKNNYEWLSKLTMQDLIKLMSLSTVQQMLERDLFQKRLKENTPIGLQEFIYPLMQGYDSVAMQVDLEIGGTDQIFNMLTGRQLCKAYLNKEKFVRANLLMEAPDALTMSKTKGNGINLGDTPENMYGKAMSYPDNLIVKGLTLLTDLPLQEINEIQKQLDTGDNPMLFKKKMAYEIVKMLKGDPAAQTAQVHFEKTVQNKEIDQENMVLTEVSGEFTLMEFIKKSNNQNLSSSEIKRLIEQGGVQINNEKLTDPFAKLVFKPKDIIKVGKRTFIQVK